MIYDWQYGGKRPVRINSTSGSAVTTEAGFYLLCAGGNGATISSVTGATSDWADFPLAPGQCLAFGGEKVTSVTLSEGEGFGYERG